MFLFTHGIDKGTRTFGAGVACKLVNAWFNLFLTLGLEYLLATIVKHIQKTRVIIPLAIHSIIRIMIAVLGLYQIPAATSQEIGIILIHFYTLIGGSRIDLVTLLVIVVMIIGYGDT